MLITINKGKNTALTGFPGGATVKNLPADAGLDPWK